MPMALCCGDRWRWSDARANAVLCATQSKIWKYISSITRETAFFFALSVRLPFLAFQSLVHMIRAYNWHCHCSAIIKGHTRCGDNYKAAHRYWSILVKSAHAHAHQNAPHPIPKPAHYSRHLHAIITYRWSIFFHLAIRSLRSSVRLYLCSALAFSLSFSLSFVRSISLSSSVSPSAILPDDVFFLPECEKF